jgi:hypothetical protein
VLIVKRCLFEGWPGWFYALQRAAFEILFCLVWLERRQTRREADLSHAPPSLFPSLDPSQLR